MSERDMIISPVSTIIVVHSTNCVDKYCIYISFSCLILTMNINLYHKTIRFFTVFYFTLSLDKMNIPYGYSDAVNRRRTDHTIANRHKNKWTNNDLHDLSQKVNYRAPQTPPVELWECNSKSCLYCTNMHCFCHCVFACLYSFISVTFS